MWSQLHSFTSFSFCTTILASGSNLTASWFSLPGLAFQTTQSNVPRFSFFLVWLIMLCSFPAFIVEFLSTLVSGIIGISHVWPCHILVILTIVIKCISKSRRPRDRLSKRQSRRPISRLSRMSSWSSSANSPRSKTQSRSQSSKKDPTPLLADYNDAISHEQPDVQPSPSQVQRMIEEMQYVKNTSRMDILKSTKKFILFYFLPANFFIICSFSFYGWTPEQAVYWNAYRHFWSERHLYPDWDLYKWDQILGSL